MTEEQQPQQTDVNDPDPEQIEPIEHEHDPNLSDAQNLDDQERAKAGLEPPERDGDDTEPEEPPAE
jgi:hypothetical protein